LSGPMIANEFLMRDRRFALPLSVPIAIGRHARFGTDTGASKH